MKEQKIKYGIEGLQAPELMKDIEWIDGNGKEISPIQLSDYESQFKVIYGFQSWCPGCHSIGLPSLKKMVEELKDNDKVNFFAIQTVFEGKDANTKDKLLEVQSKYKLPIPFGHDLGNEQTENRSSTMYNYRTGGTPWFILIDQKNRVIFNDFHLNTEKAIEYLKTIS